MKDKLILLGIASAFVFLGIESRYLHGGITDAEPVAWIPTVTAILAVILCLLGLVGDRRMNKVLGTIFLVLSLSGLIGFYFHHGGDAENTPQFDRMESLVSSNFRKDELDRSLENPMQLPPPPDLAPLSYTGLCVLAALTLMVARRETTRVS